MIRTASSTKSDLHFEYDAMGNRICKIAKPRSGSGVYNQDHWTYTYYVRDAQGNTVAVYDRDYDTPSTTYNDMFTLKENHLYGSSRVGVRAVSELQANVRYTYGGVSGGVYSGTSPVKSSTAAATKAFFHEVGRRSYELVNHLGNVLVTVSDARTANHSGAAVTGFNAVVNSATDYYAFGSPMEGRTYTSTSYRYGFNGQEKQDELHGNTGDAYDFGARMYEARLGRWLICEPHFKKYPEISPFCYVANMPTRAIDPSGKDIIVLLDPNCLAGMGHMAVLIGNDETGWRYISDGGRDETQPGNGVAGGPALPPGQAFFPNLDAFYQQQRIDPTYDRYTETVRFSTSPNQDTAAYNATYKRASTFFRTDDANCADAVSAGLTAAGLDPGQASADDKQTWFVTQFVGNPGFAIAPVERFEDIKRNNAAKIAPDNRFYFAPTPEVSLSYHPKSWAEAKASIVAMPAANSPTIKPSPSTNQQGAKTPAKSGTSGSALQSQPANTRSPGGASGNPRTALLNQPGDM